MAKSYKICLCSSFDKTHFNNGKLRLNPQASLFPKNSSTPETNIERSQLGKIYQDFESFRIEHEHNVNVPGRYFDTVFLQFFRRGEIMAYHNEKTSVLLLSGKKDDVIDFCRFTASTNVIELSTLGIDMAQLQEKLASVNLVWFKFPKGMIRASALMGSHIEETDEYQQAKEAGEISTLSFHLEDSNGIPHPIMVTQDGAVVLQANYSDLSVEIELVMRVKTKLLDDIYTEIPIKGKKTKKDQ